MEIPNLPIFDPIVFLVVALAPFVMVVLIVAIVHWSKTRAKELETHRELRVREIEHEQKMKEMEIEKAKLELEKTKVSTSL